MPVETLIDLLRVPAELVWSLEPWQQTVFVGSALAGVYLYGYLEGADVEPMPVWNFPFIALEDDDDGGDD